MLDNITIDYCNNLFNTNVFNLKTYNVLDLIIVNNHWDSYYHTDDYYYEIIRNFR
jgi:hypothetical protein